MADKGLRRVSEGKYCHKLLVFNSSRLLTITVLVTVLACFVTSIPPLLGLSISKAIKILTGYT